MRGQRRKHRGAKGGLAPRITRSACFVLIFFVIAFAFSAVPYLLYSGSVIDSNTLDFASYAAMSLAFPATAIAYIWFLEPDRKEGMAERLGLGTKGLSMGNMMLGVYVFLTILSLEVLVGLVGTVTNISIDTNAAQLFVSAPLWFYFFSAVVAPINEEVLFRGLFVPRLGIILSAVIFGMLHFSYNSTYGIEVIAAMIFGLISGYVYRRTDSIYPSIVAHIMVNALTVISAYSMLVWVLH